MTKPQTLTEALDASVNALERAREALMNLASVQCEAHDTWGVWRTMSNSATLEKLAKRYRDEQGERRSHRLDLSAGPDWSDWSKR